MIEITKAELAEYSDFRKVAAAFTTQESTIINKFLRLIQATAPQFYQVDMRMILGASELFRLGNCRVRLTVPNSIDTTGKWTTNEGMRAEIAGAYKPLQEELAKLGITLEISSCHFAEESYILNLTFPE